MKKERTNIAVAAKQLPGRFFVRLSHMPPGVWLEEPSAIDSIMSHVRRELNFIPGQWGCNVLTLAGTDRTAVSRYRQGRTAIPNDLLVRLYDLSGIPIDELRLVGGLKPKIQRHPWARKVTFKE